MIGFLHGVLFEKTLDSPALAVVDVGGVGYEVLVPLSTFAALPRAGEECRLLVHDYVREDARVLFGFATKGERELFLMLQSVSGVGPKIALAALSGMSVAELRSALAEGNAKSLAKISGIGKRTAERIVVELKGRVDPLEAAAVAKGGGDAAPAVPQAYRDALRALVQLGQSEDAAARVLREIAARPDAPKDTAAIVRAALAAKPSPATVP